MKVEKCKSTTKEEYIYKGNESKFWPNGIYKNQLGHYVIAENRKVIHYNGRDIEIDPVLFNIYRLLPNATLIFEIKE